MTTTKPPVLTDDDRMNLWQQFRDFPVDWICQYARAIELLALERAGADAVQIPEGYALVPIEPTNEMLVNVDEEVGGSCYSCSPWRASDSDCRRVYAAMLEAAPAIRALKVTPAAEDWHGQNSGARLCAATLHGKTDGPYVIQAPAAAVALSDDFRNGIRTASDHLSYIAANTDDRAWGQALNDYAADILELSPDDANEWKAINDAYAEGLKAGQRSAGQLSGNAGEVDDDEDLIADIIASHAFHDIEHGNACMNKWQMRDAAKDILAHFGAIAASKGDSDTANRSGTNTGHGHVFPRPDGLLAKCGGPGLCAQCSRDAASKGANHG